MKIAFDSQTFSLQEYGGISRYFCSLAEQLANTHDVEANIIAPFYVNAYLGRLPETMVSGIRVPKIPAVSTLFHLGGLLLARRAITRFAPQIVHETYYAATSSTPKGVRSVLTVHDMIHELFPSEFSQHDHTSIIKKEAVLRADHIICISEHTRRDLLNLIPISPDKLSVVYHGFDQLATLPKQAGSKSNPPKFPYLLFVGKREGYKNFVGLLQAYASSTWLMQNYRVACVGGGKLKVDELKLMHKLGLSKTHVKQINADDDLLAEYYRNAVAFIYPSKYEGFGIPPLEAMSLKCPVVCSNTSSIPEVVGQAGEYFDPNSIDSIRFAIEQVLQNNERREFLIQKGIERCAFFSWQRCASETLAIYRRIV